MSESVISEGDKAMLELLFGAPSCHCEIGLVIWQYFSDLVQISLNTSSFLVSNVI